MTTKEKCVDFLKDCIFALLTSDYDWRGYGSGKFLGKSTTLDEFISETTDKMVSDLSKVKDYDEVDIAKYIPCISNLHGDYYHTFNDDLVELFGLHTCELCTDLMSNGIEMTNPEGNPREICKDCFSKRDRLVSWSYTNEDGTVRF